PISSNNPYMQCILGKNSRSSAFLNNSTCSAAAKMKKNGLNSQQLRSKRRPRVPENMQLSQSILKMESSRHGLFTARAHSLSRSPPRKSSRPDDSI
ncbi:unnamed protein product, partial [Acanthocheilonema viteae]